MFKEGKRTLGHGKVSDYTCVIRRWQIANEICACVWNMKLMNDLL